MTKQKQKLPGKGMRILSFIPIFNCFALVYIGVTNEKLVNVLCGAAYFIISMAVPEIAALLWITCIIHYAIAHRGVKKRMTNSTTLPIFEKHYVNSNIIEKQQQFSDVTLSGVEERKQVIPTRSYSDSSPVSVSFSYEMSKDKFFKDMKKYENKVGTVAPFEPFMTYWPTYGSMSKDQQNWYFYWRTETRKQHYIHTDLSYIFIYIYELLSGVGWKTPQEGYDKLIKLWQAYQQQFPKLDGYLYSWSYDFATLHNLEHTKLIPTISQRLAPSAKTDVLIDQYSNDVPLKLPFDLIDALCDYSLVGSKFYKEGNQSLMQEAIPRVIALADAMLRKQKNKGLLDIYGPTRAKKQEYYAFTSAVCPQANKKISVTVKAYSSNTKLRGYINELVRYAENTLRALNGYRGRLRGVTLDEETSKIVESFLKKEYGNIKPTLPERKENATLTLDFKNIATLREQSDSVRSALMVEDATITEEKGLLTDVVEITAIFMALSNNAKTILDRLHKLSWECKKEPSDESLIAEVNRLAEHYLGCHLLTVEDDNVIVEDDYRDEMDYIYENPPSVSSPENNQSYFNIDILSDHLREFLAALVPEQRKALRCIMVQENVHELLERIAEEAMTMPQILIDDINATAMQVLGDIIIDADMKIVSEYEDELKNSIV